MIWRGKNKTTKTTLNDCSLPRLQVLTTATLFFCAALLSLPKELGVLSGSGCFRRLFWWKSGWRFLRIDAKEGKIFRCTVSVFLNCFLLGLFIFIWRTKLAVIHFKHRGIPVHLKSNLFWSELFWFAGMRTALVCSPLFIALCCHLLEWHGVRSAKFKQRVNNSVNRLNNYTPFRNLT